MGGIYLSLLPIIDQHTDLNCFKGPENLFSQ